MYFYFKILQKLFCISIHFEKYLPKSDAWRAAPLMIICHNYTECNSPIHITIHVTFDYNLCNCILSLLDIYTLYKAFSYYGTCCCNIRIHYAISLQRCILYTCFMYVTYIVGVYIQSACNAKRIWLGCS